MTAPFIEASSPSPDGEGDDRDNQIDLEELDRKVAALAKLQPAFAAIPIPRVGPSYILQSRHPHRDLLEEASLWHDPAALATIIEQARLAKRGEACQPEERITYAGSWWSSRLYARVDVWRTHAGRHLLATLPRPLTAMWYDRLHLRMRTQQASGQISLGSELRAQRRLQAVVTPEQWRLYTLTGSFMERSKRSAVIYWFRRLRPTIALRSRGSTEGLRVALCLHGLGYHVEAHAGLLAPSADVLTHLLLMRTDEHLYWKRAEQHSLADPRAGV